MQKLPIKTPCHVCNTQLELIRQTNSEGIDKGYALCPTCESITTCTCGGKNIQTDPIAINEPVPELTFIGKKIKIDIDFVSLQKRILKLAQLLHKQTFK